MDCIQRDPLKFIEYINYKKIKEDPIFFLQAFRSNPNLLNQKNLPYEILHSIGLKLLKQGYSEDEIIPIFLYGFKFCKNKKLNSESSYQLGKINFYGKKKDFKKSKFFFEESLKIFENEKSILELNKLNRFLKLDDENLKIIENCSNEKNYIFEKQIYSPSNSKRWVFKVKNKQNKKIYALKKIQIDIFDFNETLNEITTLIKLKNDSICEIFDFFIQENEEYGYFYFCIIMPLYDLDLFKFIQSNKKLNENVTILIINIYF